MAKNSPTEVIETYRRRQVRRFPFTFAEISSGLLFILLLASSFYVLFVGKPELPTLVDLKTNTPTYTPSITPTPTQTATITPTATDTPDTNLQCNCSTPQVIVITATFRATETQPALPTATATALLPPTVTLEPTQTLIPTETPTATASAVPTPTQIAYTVKPGDTLGGIALRYGVTIEAIQALNNLNTTLITVGQVLQIPRP